MADQIYSATQPEASTVLDQSVAPPIKPEAMKKLGAKMAAKFTQYESDRKLAELKWARNARQYLGVYDPEIEQVLDKNRSRAYPKITRVKCVSMLSRLMNLLFQAGDKNWTVAPSPVPDIDEQDLQRILDAFQVQPGQQPDTSAIDRAIYDFAKEKAKNLEVEIEDQLKELGGGCTMDYVALCRKVIMSGVQYGAGILCGPYVEEQEVRTWTADATGKLLAGKKQAFRPRYEWTSIWDYYPDMSAKMLHQMEGQFLRRVLSKHQLIALKQRKDFTASQIDEALRIYPQGNYMRKAFETELRADGAQVNAQDHQRGKYEAVCWYGYCTGAELKECGVKVADADLNRDKRCEVWTVGNVVIKVMLNPWEDLGVYGKMNHFHHFIFEEDETFILGNGLPNIMRDSQMGVCAATRISLDNASVQRVFELNRRLLPASNDMTAITPDKVFYREDEDASTLAYPAIRVIDIKSNLAENQALIRQFQDFADQETFVNAATGGDMQRGPSEPFRTATGASMLRGDAALPFKDVVRNFDAFTESVIGSIINFNKVFNPDPKIRGDFTPIARGATSLIAKEVLGIQLDNLATTLSDEEKRYLKPLNLLRERVRVRDLIVDDIVMTDAEAAERDAQDSQMAAQQKQISDQAQAAQIAEIRSQAMKNVSQAGKNDANAAGEKAGMVMDAMQMGIDVNQQEHENELRQQEQAAGAAAKAGGVSGGSGNGQSASTSQASAGGSRPAAKAMPTR